MIPSLSFVFGSRSNLEDSLTRRIPMPRIGYTKVTAYGIRFYPERIQL
jgi:hypothetical protein